PLLPCSREGEGSDEKGRPPDSFGGPAAALAGASCGPISMPASDGATEGNGAPSLDPRVLIACRRAVHGPGRAPSGGWRKVPTPQAAMTIGVTGKSRSVSILVAPPGHPRRLTRGRPGSRLGGRRPA